MKRILLCISTAALLFGHPGPGYAEEAVASPLAEQTAEGGQSLCSEQSELELSHWEHGKQLFVDGHYGDAIVLFEKCYTICPKAIYLHNIALALHRSGKYQPAIAMYQRYLSESKEQRFRSEALSNLNLLSTLLEQQAGLERDRHRPLWRRASFWGGLTAGVVAVTGLAVGLGVGFSPQTLHVTFK